MCGRFYIHIEEDHSTLIRIREKIKQQNASSYANNISCSIKKWGLESYRGNLLINAYNETLTEKKRFHTRLTKRCIIPCNGFFEWKQNPSVKRKMFIHKASQRLLYWAGIYNEHSEFVNVKEKSNGLIHSTHHRSPQIAEGSRIANYLQMKWNSNHAEQDFVFEEIA